MNEKTKVLVVDDSLLFREILSRGISSDPSLEVVAKAVDPYDARDKILEFKPDVMICDIQMPKMNGIEFVRRLMPQYPLPVIVISTISDSVFEAMNAGAVEFVEKPDVNSVEGVKEFVKNLNNKIKIATYSKINIPKDKILKEAKQKEKYNSKKNFKLSQEYDLNKIIAIGASTGGTEAISSILKSAPANIPGIVIVQHIPPVFSKMFADRLNTSIDLTVKEAETGDLIENGKVLIAPGDKHMRIKKNGSKYMVECFDADKVNGHKPSVDVLFESVAQLYKDNAIGIVLTGMGYDGAKGLLSIRKSGGRTIAQDKESSVVYGMPQVAYNIGAVEKQVSLEGMPHAIYSFLHKNKI